MRLCELVTAVRSALHVGKIPCELSDWDLECIVRESIVDVGGRHREHVIVECAAARAREMWAEIAVVRAAPANKPGPPRKAPAPAPRRRRKSSG